MNKVFENKWMQYVSALVRLPIINPAQEQRNSNINQSPGHAPNSNLNRINVAVTLLDRPLSQFRNHFQRKINKS